MATRPQDTQATFCATLVDEWVRCGVEHAVVAPGSRSTPMALALAADGRIDIHVHHDERSAGFMAIGLALTTWEPTVVLTTSGTAAVEVHAAVVEADLAAVPLIVCTADRPSELIDVGAPQAIDQTHLYGRSVRWFHAPGVADEVARERWRPLAARAYAEATGPRRGPVHLNLAFREPLLGKAGALPSPRSVEGAGWSWRPPVQAPVDPVISLVEDFAGRRGLILAGEGSGNGDMVERVARALGWPVVASPQAPVWAHQDVVVPAADPLLRVPALREELRPEVVLRLGGPLASRVVNEWVAETGAVEIVVAGPGAWIDPSGTASVVLSVEPGQILVAWCDEGAHVEPVDGGSWLEMWRRVGGAAQMAVDAVLDANPASEPGVARSLVRALPAGAVLVVSSSMPIRDLEWFVGSGEEISVFANRGANGIDGVVSTAVGAALGREAPTALLIGDIAFLHDSNGLIAAAARGIDLIVVVVDNDGGGIFSFLPQADAVDREVFELLYGTPHGLDLARLASAYGATASVVTDLDAALERALAAGGVHVLVARSERASNAHFHEVLNAAVADAVTL